MGNCNKIKNTCLDSTFATCVDYENTLGDNTKLNQPCITLDDTTKDLYELVDDLFDKVDLSEVPNDCLSYIGDKDIKKVVQKYEEEICTLKEKVATLESTAICDMSLEDCGINFQCLEEQCGGEIVTLKDFIIAITNNACGA